jgi:hypothetical protein
MTMSVGTVDCLWESVVTVNCLWESVVTVNCLWESVVTVDCLWENTCRTVMGLLKGTMFLRTLTTTDIN